MLRNSWLTLLLKCIKTLWNLILQTTEISLKILLQCILLCIFLSLSTYWKLDKFHNNLLLEELSKGWVGRIHIGSVLTRILPWGVPGPPLLRNRGPVRTLGGQSYKKHAVRRTWARTPKLSVTWSTYLIQYGGRGVYDSEEEFTM